MRPQKRRNVRGIRTYAARTTTPCRHLVCTCSVPMARCPQSLLFVHSMSGWDFLLLCTCPDDMYACILFCTHTLGLTDMITFLCVRMRIALTLPALLRGESRMVSRACRYNMYAGACTETSVTAEAQQRRADSFLRLKWLQDRQCALHCKALAPPAPCHLVADVWSVQRGVLVVFPDVRRVVIAV